MILQLIELWEKVLIFMESGGDVLLGIFAVTVLMWALILERIWYFSMAFPREAREVEDRWRARLDKTSWCAQKIQEQEISEMSLRLRRSLPMIAYLIAVCPLLGLLGTVTGMIQVFEIMAMVGSGNARAMASGVSMATIPTMAGMVVALSGMYFNARLGRQAKTKIVHLKDAMKIERGETCVAA